MNIKKLLSATDDYVVKCAKTGRIGIIERFSVHPRGVHPIFREAAKKACQ